METYFPLCKLIYSTEWKCWTHYFPAWVGPNPLKGSLIWIKDTLRGKQGDKTSSYQGLALITSCKLSEIGTRWGWIRGKSERWGACTSAGGHVTKSGHSKHLLHWNLISVVSTGISSGGRPFVKVTLGVFYRTNKERLFPLNFTNWVKCLKNNVVKNTFIRDV